MLENPNPTSNPPAQPAPTEGTRAPATLTFVALLFLGVLIAGHWRSIESATALFQLKVGDLIRRTGEVPNRDIFSMASRADAWVYFEWLWAVFASGVYEYGKWMGLSGLNVLLGLLTLGLTTRRSKSRTGTWFEPLVISAIAGGALLPVFQPEPAYAVLPVYVLSLLLTEARRRSPMVLFPPLVALWANMHSSVMLAFVAPLMLTIMPDSDSPAPKEKRRLYLGVIIAAGLLAILINPHSVRIVPGLWYNAVAAVTAAPAHLGDLLSEANVLVRIAAAAMFFLLALIMRSLTRRDAVNSFVLVAAFFAFGDLALNFLLLYLAAPAALATSRLLAKQWQKAQVRYLAGIACLAALLAWFAIAALATRLTPDAWRTGLRKNVFPETAAGRLSALPLRAGILNSPSEGGYLLWRLWPNWKVSADHRLQVYDPGFFDQYEDIWRGADGWQAFMATWRVHAVLGSTEITTRYPDQNLYHELAASDEWTAAYWDRRSILYVKSDLELASTNLSEFRVLKPGLPWPKMAEQLQTSADWQDLRADLRRALVDDPGNSVALEFLRRAEERR